MALVFFSYSHKDEQLRDELETHLKALQRQGIISTWHDRRIVVGSEFNGEIDEKLSEADVILLLVSADFIASDYCYDVEVNEAMRLHGQGKAKVVPVILRPCDWHGLPFGKLLATPTDGMAVTKFPNIDDAFLDITKAIKSAVKELNPSASSNVLPYNTPSLSKATSSYPSSIRSSNLAIKKDFTDADRDQFLEDSFDYVAKFFENSLKALVSRNQQLEFKYKEIDAHRFTACIYRNGSKVRDCTLWRGGGSRPEIFFSYGYTNSSNSYNETIHVEDDGNILFLSNLLNFGNDKSKLSMHGAAEYFWEMLIEPLQR